jgi:curved DNA-binding protein
MAKDYYEILGVSRDASAEELKKAFRRLAMQHHPDRAEDKVAAEAKFKEINEAYAVLSDPEKRKQYDMFGADHFHQQFSQEDIFRGFNFGSIQDMLGDLGFGGDVFTRVFGGSQGGRRGHRAGARGFDPFGAGAPFPGGFGAGFTGHGGPVKGQDTQAEVTLPFEEAILGCERQLSLSQPGGGAARSLKVKIPPGTADGSKLRLKGQGGPGPAGAEPGDLFLQVRVGPHPRFQRRGEQDLQTEIHVSVTDLVLGGTAVVGTLQGVDKRIKVRPGTQPGTALRLRGFGVPKSKSRPAGDLYAIVQVSVPQDLSEEQTRLFEQLRSSGL